MDQSQQVLPQRCSLVGEGIVEPEDVLGDHLSKLKSRNLVGIVRPNSLRELPLAHLLKATLSFPEALLLLVISLDHAYLVIELISTICVEFAIIFTV